MPLNHDELSFVRRTALGAMVVAIVVTIGDLTGGIDRNEPLFLLGQIIAPPGIVFCAEMFWRTFRNPKRGGW